MTGSGFPRLARTSVAAGVIHQKRDGKRGSKKLKVDCYRNSELDDSMTENNDYLIRLQALFCPLMGDGPIQAPSFQQDFPPSPQSPPGRLASSQLPKSLAMPSVCATISVALNLSATQAFSSKFRPELELLVPHISPSPYQLQLSGYKLHEGYGFR